MHNMGLHYLNPDIKGFSVTKPQILVYSRRGQEQRRVAVLLLAPGPRDQDVWLWYPNPDGLYASMNPFVAPFNRG